MKMLCRGTRPLARFALRNGEASEMALNDVTLWSRNLCPRDDGEGHRGDEAIHQRATRVQTEHVGAVWFQYFEVARWFQI